MVWSSDGKMEHGREPRLTFGVATSYAAVVTSPARQSSCRNNLTGASFRIKVGAVDAALNVETDPTPSTMTELSMTDREQPHLDDEAARAGTTSHVTRYMLIISLILTIAIFGYLLIGR